jgi:hypothetical protein
VIRSPEESRGAVVVENLLQGGVAGENLSQACWRELLVNVITLHWRLSTVAREEEGLSSNRDCLEAHDEEAHGDWSSVALAVDWSFNRQQDLSSWAPKHSLLHSVRIAAYAPISALPELVPS